MKNLLILSENEMIIEIATKLFFKKYNILDISYLKIKIMKMICLILQFKNKKLYVIYSKNRLDKWVHENLHDICIDHFYNRINI